MPRSGTVPGPARPRAVLIGAAAVALLGGVLAAPGPAAATCLPVSGLPGGGIVPASLRAPAPVPAPLPGLRRAQAGPEAPAPAPDAAPPEGSVALTYLGHSSFLLRTPGNVTAITDYNGYVRAEFPPDIVTMNHAHDSHYTEFVEPGVGHVLRGWTGPEGFPDHDLTVRDLRVRAVPTNIRDGAGGVEVAGNSVFVFETAGLCIAHLGHLHHQLTAEQRGRIGAVDVLLVPIDDGFTMPQEQMAAVIADLAPRVVVPMHFFGGFLVARFLDRMRARGWRALRHDQPAIRLARGALPRRTVLVLPGNLF